LLLVCVAMLVWLQAKFFALFFAVYIVAALLLNLAWGQGWRGIAPPEVYPD
jgi:CDP-diacylglycerol--serine O-phosphatidyltransferase